MSHRLREILNITNTITEEVFMGIYIGLVFIQFVIVFYWLCYLYHCKVAETSQIALRPGTENVIIDTWKRRERVE